MALGYTVGANTSNSLDRVYQSYSDLFGNSLWSWGYNLYGQLGVGDVTHRSSPVQVGTLTTWSGVSGGGFHSLALKTDGTLWSWGYNLYGQLGLGDTTYRSSPVQVGSLTTWSGVSGSYYHCLALQNY